MFHKLICLALLTSVVRGIALAQTPKPNIAPLPAGVRSLKTCDVHRTALQTGTAPILYGRRPRIVDPKAVRAFPHADSHTFGGCIVSNDSPDLQAVKFCPKCRAAENRWLRAHRKSIPTR